MENLEDLPEDGDSREMFGVDVWACVTIYVKAETQVEAEETVRKRYAGTVSDPDTYDHLNSEDLPMDGEDFMSSAMTFYGIAPNADLVEKTDCPFHPESPEGRAWEEQHC